jgi:hypothetical protein
MFKFQPNLAYIGCPLTSVDRNCISDAATRLSSGEKPLEGPGANKGRCHLFRLDAVKMWAWHDDNGGCFTKSRHAILRVPSSKKFVVLHCRILVNFNSVKYRS